ncbi:MAG: tetratricopeptide repeat protein, partial [Phycisphaerales bacterium]|nr:tetratricopeptide repeat protein [Phycisphaerales bacterium]
RRATQGDVSDALSRLRASGEDPVLIVIAERCLARNPEDRPRDAGALTADVSRYLAELEESAQAAKVAAAAAEAKAAEERRARRLTIALAASLFFVVALVGAGFYWRAESQRQRVAEATGLAGAALERAASLLGQAKASRADDGAAWDAAVAAGEQLERLIAAGPVEENTQRRADALLADLRAADADRRLLALTDDIVQQGATHSDVDSWKRMDDAYVEAFRDAGIDVRTASDEAIAAWIRKSEHPERLANAFELWVWTGEDLKHRFGVNRYTRSLRDRATPIFLADTDPFRTKLRDQMYRLLPESNTIDVNVLRELADDPAFETAPATSLSWLGTCFFSAMEPDFKGGMRVYRRAVALYPDDFLLNSDYARMLAMLGKDAEASRILSRCVALRPGVSGAWRTLGITLRKLESYQEAIEAIRRAISLQPDHMPTYVDLWLTCVAMGNLDEATSALEKAKSLAGDAIETHVMLMRALPERSPMERTGQLERAIALLESAQSGLPDDADGRSRLDSWMTECRKAIEYREATLPEVPEWAMPEIAD